MQGFKRTPINQARNARCHNLSKGRDTPTFAKHTCGGGNLSGFRSVSGKFVAMLPCCHGHQRTSQAFKGTEDDSLQCTCQRREYLHELTAHELAATHQESAAISDVNGL